MHAASRDRSRRSAGVSLLCLLVAAALGCRQEEQPARSSRPAPPKDAPNVLLLTLDTTRADRLGCYGYSAAQTPALDALAARGVRVE